MLRPTTNNSIENGDGNVQVGHNDGTISVTNTFGYTVEQHEAALQRAVSEKAADLERAHGAEKALLQSQLDALKSKLADLENDYKERLLELERVKLLLARNENRLDQTKRDAAYRALESGESTLAQILLKDLAKQARARREDASREEAELEFELGKLAESEVRWVDAAQHFVRSAELVPSFEPLLRATQFALASGEYREALRLAEKLVRHARETMSRDHLARALDRQGAVLRKLGRLRDAEAVYREAIDIAAEAFGQNHPQYATSLNHLGLVLYALQQHEEAETYLKNALGVLAASIGKNHAFYATTLGNLAMVLEAQGRLARAERIYMQALAIDRETIGERHPDHASRLNSLAVVYLVRGKVENAEATCLKALSVDREVLGEQHPDYAIGLNTLAQIRRIQGRRYEANTLLRQALSILEATLPPDHPYIQDLRKKLAE